MTNRSTAQSWALDAAIAQGGFDALHPQARGIIEAFGVDHTDYDKVFGQTCRWPAARSAARLPPNSRSRGATQRAAIALLAL